MRRDITGQAMARLSSWVVTVAAVAGAVVIAETGAPAPPDARKGPRPPSPPPPTLYAEPLPQLAGALYVIVSTSAAAAVAVGEGMAPQLRPADTIEIVVTSAAELYIATARLEGIAMGLSQLGSPARVVVAES
jgi:hypothetical protein